MKGATVYFFGYILQIKILPKGIDKIFEIGDNYAVRGQLILFIVSNFSVFFTVFRRGNSDNSFKQNEKLFRVLVAYL